MFPTCIFSSTLLLHLLLMIFFFPILLLHILLQCSMPSIHPQLHGPHATPLTAIPYSVQVVFDYSTSCQLVCYFTWLLLSRPNFIVFISFLYFLVITTLQLSTVVSSIHISLTFIYIHSSYSYNNLPNPNPNPNIQISIRN